MICAVALVLGLTTSPVLPLSYEFDFNGDEVWDTEWTLEIAETKQAEIWLDSYSCAPDDKLFGVQLYIQYDHTKIQINEANSYPNDFDHGGPFDPDLSFFNAKEDGVYALTVSHFNFVNIPENKILLSVIELECIADGDVTIKAANDLGFGGYTDGFVADCNLKYLYPDDANPTVHQGIPTTTSTTFSTTTSSSQPPPDTTTTTGAATTSTTSTLSTSITTTIIATTTTPAPPSPPESTTTTTTSQSKTTTIKESTTTTMTPIPTPSTTTSASSTTVPNTTSTISSTTTTTTDDSCPLEEIYGKHSEKTERLRHFRDNVLSQTPVGQEIIKLYYQWSPAIVNALEEDEKFKENLKEMIDGVLLQIFFQ